MRRRWIILVLGSAVTAGVVVCWPRGPKEPVYQGKRLSEWLEAAGPAKEPEMVEAACKALKAIGTNALPYLISQFCHENSGWAASINKRALDLGLTNIRLETGEDRIRMATGGLMFLGPDAAPALPMLAEYLGDSQRGLNAAWVMSACGEVALPYLLKATASTNPQAVDAALIGLGEMADHNESAVLPLLVALKHTNGSVRVRAALSLSSVRLRPDLIVPALIQALTDSEPQVQNVASNSLGELKEAAKQGVPDLMRLLRNSDPRVAALASNALQRIAPSALSAQIE